MFFWQLFFQNKSCLHFEFLMNQIFGQKFVIFEKWGIGVNYCWEYGPSKLLLRFVEYRLGQLNNKHTEIAVNSAIRSFWKSLSKEMSGKSLKLFGEPATKWRLFKILAKLNGNHILIAIVFKLHEYQTFNLMKMHNMSKIWFANNKFS